MHKIIRILVVALTCTALTACTQHVDQDNNGWDVGTDVGDDARTDAGDDTGDDVSDDTGNDAGEDINEDVDDGGDTGEDNYEVHFELVNNANRPISVSPATSSARLCFGDTWLHVRDDGSELQLTDNTCVENCPSSGDPIGCTADCAAPAPESFRLADGDRRSFTWDAKAWTTTDDSCEIAESMAGKTLTAEFCYGASFDEQNFELVGERCETVEFSIDQPSQTVRVTIDEERPNEVVFKMINETGKDLYARPNGLMTPYSCYGSWYSLSAYDRAVTPVRGCNGVCSCEQVEQNPDEQCITACPARAPCPAPTAEALLFEANSERSDTWDGLITIDDEVADQECERRVVPLADQLVATMCYAEEIDESNGYAELVDPTCEDVRFERTTDDVVEWRIQ